MQVVLVTGGFDPIHSGHIDYLNNARSLGDKLIVGLNSDYWLKNKKGRHFMPWDERRAILESLKMVDHVLEFNDNDGTACNAIERVLDIYGNVVFANGGDRSYENIPEMKKFDTDSRVKFVFGIGGDTKKNSSRWILEEWRSPKTERQWGYYRVLYEYDKHTKLKELTVLPGKTLSMQRHKDRAEFWFVGEGEATVYTMNISSDAELVGKYTKHQSLRISKQQWHMLANETNMPLKIIEIQYGENCIESDIERKYYEQS
jgi:cytidyltransferase-like protein